VFVDESVRGRVDVTKLQKIRSRRVGEGLLCVCETSVSKLADAEGERKYHDSNTRNSDDVKEEDFILCISGEAQVWLPGVMADPEK